MTEIDRDKLVRMAVKSNLVEWAYEEPSQNIVCLGPKAEEKMKTLLTKVVFARDGLAALFATFSDHDLQVSAGIKVGALSSGSDMNLVSLRRKAREHLPRFGRYEMIRFGFHKDELANYAYWKNRDSYSKSEFVWLSMGLEPSPQLDKHLQATPASLETLDESIRKEGMLRASLVSSARGIEDISGNISAEHAHEWLQTIEIDVPDGFRKALELAWRRLTPKEAQEKNQQHIEVGESNGPDSREMRSMARLLTAIAIEEYGYNPNARRSPLPNQLEGICDQNGLGVSAETIRKYLRLGAKLISDN